MNKHELLDHLHAHSLAYYRTADYHQERGDIAKYQRDLGKADAFATAAGWLAEMASQA